MVMTQAIHPALYEINTRVWLQEIASKLGRPATLDDVPNASLDRLAERGIDLVWLLGVWQTGPAGRTVSVGNPQWRAGYKNILPDFKDDDVCGSPFAIRQYAVDESLGGPEALCRMRQRLRERGIRLVLDFVANHTALDHPWIDDHPEYYVQGTDRHHAEEPQNFCRIETPRGLLVLAHGRDPYFSGWPDTLQLNYQHGGLRQAMTAELLAAADQCDGLRCDMAMLILPDVFQRTWDGLATPADGSAPVNAPFWPKAIAQVRERRPDFVFMAEVYWDLEWALQQQGFDYTYDKRLYDRLHARDAESVRKHLWAEIDFQRKSARFLEKHDEPRAAGAFPPHIHKTAATVAFLSPGLHFFHDGQLEGRRIRAGVHLNRRPVEPIDVNLQTFYLRLLECVRRPEVRSGNWRLLECRPAWEGNPTANQFLAFAWDNPQGDRLLVAVNYGHSRGQCYVHHAFPDLPGKKWLLRDLLDSATYERDRDSLAAYGLYLDLPEWGRHVFELKPIS
jgi:hypothetical protein